MLDKINPNLKAAVVGYWRQGASVAEIINLTGLPEYVILELKPKNLKVK